MDTKKTQRIRRATRTRAKIKQLRVYRLCVTRSNQHISAQLIAPCGTKTLLSASTVEKALCAEHQLKNGSNKEAAVAVGKVFAQRAIGMGVKSIAFDRSGFRFHGRVKALADAARASGLEF